MRHAHSGRKLGRSPEHRRATLRALTLALIENESIQTIPSRAKELRWFAERAVTLGKRGDVPSIRQLIVMLGSTQTNIPGENRVRNAVEKICKDLAPRFKERQGGYTQIFKLASRRAGDNAEQCIMRYLPGPENKTAKAPKDKTENKKLPKETKKASETVVAEKPVTKKAEKTVKPTSEKKTKAAKKD